VIAMKETILKLLNDFEEIEGLGVRNKCQLAAFIGENLPREIKAIEVERDTAQATLQEIADNTDYFRQQSEKELDRTNSDIAYGNVHAYEHVLGEFMEQGIEPKKEATP
jgi:hypothetical protein